ncbi:MAG: hypothetical protein NHB14_16740 [Desulfosporosinus sp.]|nr:hypothetical protein [Desulfosporosinus sp.]
MKIIKLIKLIAISLVGIFMFSGCGSANSQNPGDLQGTNKTDIVGTVIKLTKNQSGEIIGTILVEGEKGSKPYWK